MTTSGQEAPFQKNVSSKQKRQLLPQTTVAANPPQEMKVNHDITLRLSTCTGGYKNTELAPWAPTWSELKARLSQPTIGAKDGEYFIRAEGAKRSDKTVEQTGYAVILDGDKRIDPETGEVFEGAPDPALVHAVLARLGVPHVIYSSHSNGKTEAEVDAFNAAERERLEKHNAKGAAKAAAEGKPFKPVDIEAKMYRTGGAYGAEFHKWRAVIPCEIQEPDLGRTVAWLVEQLHAEGVMLANVKENSTWSQPWFFPRVPDDASLCLFKFYATEPGMWVAPEMHASRAEQSQPHPAEQPQPQSQSVSPAEQPKPKHASAIEHFNSKWTPGDVLTRAGYEQPNPNIPAWRRPGSANAPGVKICPDRSKERGIPIVYSHHGDDDPLADGLPHDAFDCMRILGFNGDMTAAIAEVYRMYPELRHSLENYFAPGEDAISQDDAIAEVQAEVDKLVRSELGAKPLKAFAEDRMVFLMSIIADHDLPTWVQIQSDLRLHNKGNSTLVTQIFNAVKKACADRKKARVALLAAAKKNEAHGLVAYSYGADVMPGFGLGFDDKGKPRLCDQSVVARLCLPYLQGLLSYDPSIGMWYQFAGTHWQMLDSEHGPSAVFQNLLEIAGGGGLAGFNLQYKNGVIALCEGSGQAPKPMFTNKVLPFSNGVLYLKDGVLYPTTPATAQEWFLPYAYDADADCPKIKAWLRQAMGGDKEMVHFLRCAFAATLLGMGRDVQKFINLMGAAGSGKGTISRLLKAMLGSLNIYPITMKALERGQFTMQYVKDKRLLVISDLETWGKEVDMLNCLTGGDPVPFDIKNKNLGGTPHFTYEGMVLILSNRHLTTDNTSAAIMRRRLTVPFDEAFSEQQLQQWQKDGGEQQLHDEMPGFVNWLLGVSKDEILDALRNPPLTVQDTNRDADAESNSVAAWLAACCKPMPDVSTPVGAASKITITAADGCAQGTRSYQVYEDADKHLYPNYLTWCSRHAVGKPETHNTFSNTIADVLRRWGVIKGVGKKTRRSYGYTVANVALKGKEDSPETDFFDYPEWLRK